MWIFKLTSKAQVKKMIFASEKSIGLPTEIVQMNIHPKYFKVCSY